MDTLFYSYAKDNKSNLVSINNAIKGGEYFCINCGARLITKMGKIRRPHFAHKVNSKHCSYETYLHKLAKYMIANRFNNSDHFYIYLQSKRMCSIEKCPINYREPCTWNFNQKFDLKEFYNKCDIEIKYNGFIADLLLYNSNIPQREPIFIEIWVTHKSSDEKINSGNRIIEIKIYDETDINNIVNSLQLSETPTDCICLPISSNHTPYVKFWGFKPQIQKVLPDKVNSAQLYAFWITDSKSFRFNFSHNRHQLTCLSKLPEQIENSIFRIVSRDKINVHYAFYKLLEANLGLKFCNMCQHYHSYACTLHESGIKKYPDPRFADKCNFFSQIKYIPSRFIHDELICETIIKSKPETK